MSTLVEHAPVLPHCASRPATPPPHITLNTSIRGTPAAVPNKHIPVCSPGRGPASPGVKSPLSSPATLFRSSSTILSSPDAFLKLQEPLPIYSIEAPTIADVLDQQATRPLLDPKRVFPWLHGLHPENTIQLAFFVARRKTLRKIPQDIRSLTIIKAGGDLTKARIKGAVAPDEVLTPESLNLDTHVGYFQDADPKDGFSVRNFQIQTAKLATVSDIIVYGDDDTPADHILLLANKISSAQRAWKKKVENLGWETGVFNTFVCLDSFKIFEEICPEIVSINSQGEWTGKVLDFCECCSKS
jgi:dual specificity MAP kinase phosphatase